MPEYVTYRTKVRKWSTVRVANRTYTVPSRLIGFLPVSGQVDVTEGSNTECRCTEIGGVRSDGEGIASYVPRPRVVEFEVWSFALPTPTLRSGLTCWV